MKALSLWQPWASLIAYGLKRVETRDWTKAHRGATAIHAAKVWGPTQREAWQEFGDDWARELMDASMPTDPPLGCVVAVVDVRDVRLMTPAWIAEQTDMERAFGLWLPGRYGFVLDNVHRVDPPVPWKGGQGYFNVPLGAAPQLQAAYEACADGIAKRQGAAW